MVNISPKTGNLELSHTVIIIRKLIVSISSLLSKFKILQTFHILQMTVGDPVELNNSKERPLRMAGFSVFKDLST